MNAWQKIKECPPPENERLLVSDGDWICLARSLGGYIYGDDSEFDGWISEPTHWMKLPEPPEV